MKVAFVTPRYGEHVIGGAEAAARAFAEHLVADLGFEVEVFTTCAIDYTTWADEMDPGTQIINSVSVHRFLSQSGRNIDDDRLWHKVWNSPASASYEECMDWIRMCGPVTTDLIEALENNDADVVVFYPYLYYMTVHGIMNVRQPVVLHPAAHDEPVLYFAPFLDVFRAADALVFQTIAERQLVEKTMRVADKPQILLGVGADAPPPVGQDSERNSLLGSRRYVVCIGRVDAHKGVVMLAEFFREFKRRHPSDLALVFVGPVVADLPNDQDIIVTGVVSELERWEILRGADVLISPSALEAFSLVIMESWQVKIPVMVNALCGATAEHCEKSGGGLVFGSYHSFEASLVRLLGDQAFRQVLGERGYRYVQERYSWPVVIGRYGSFLQEVVDRGPIPKSEGLRLADFT